MPISKFCGDNIFFFRFGSARRQRKEINLSLVLLCIVLVFFCCHACRIIIDIYEFINMQKVEDCRLQKKGWNPPYLWEALYPISNVFKILNSSLNFFVYCLVGHTFRRELCRTLGLKVRNVLVAFFLNHQQIRFLLFDTFD